VSNNAIRACSTAVWFVTLRWRMSCVGVQIMIEDLELMELRKRIDVPAHGARARERREGSEGVRDGGKRGRERSEMC